jgi:hypothetical protein
VAVGTGVLGTAVLGTVVGTFVHGRKNPAPPTSRQNQLNRRNLISCRGVTANSQ